MSPPMSHARTTWFALARSLRRPRAARPSVAGHPGSGPAAPFADLHPALSWHADRLDVRVRFDSRVALVERGLVIIPSAFHREGVAPIVDPPWQPTLVYPARGLAAGLVTAGATGREVL